MTLSNRIRQRALSSAPFPAPNTWDFISSELIELWKEDDNEDEDKEMKEDQADDENDGKVTKMIRALLVVLVMLSISSGHCWASSFWALID